MHVPSCCRPPQTARPAAGEPDDEGRITAASGHPATGGRSPHPPLRGGAGADSPGTVPRGRPIRTQASGVEPLRLTGYPGRELCSPVGGWRACNTARPSARHWALSAMAWGANTAPPETLAPAPDPVPTAIAHAASALLPSTRPCPQARKSTSPSTPHSTASASARATSPACSAAIDAHTRRPGAPMRHQAEAAPRTAVVVVQGAQGASKGETAMPGMIRTRANAPARGCAAPP
jgi:hypothetical protein